jgi:hypothetical protein
MPDSDDHCLRPTFHRRPPFDCGGAGRGGLVFGLRLWLHERRHVRQEQEEEVLLPLQEEEGEKGRNVKIECGRNVLRDFHVCGAR